MMTKKYLLPALLTVSCLGLTACGQTAAVPDTIKVENVESQVITVESSETVKVVPDVAQVIFAVYTQAQNPEDCQTQNNLDVDKVLQTLDGLGVEETSIQTSGYGLSPIYDWNSGQNTVTGYEMSTNVTVSDIPIEQVGTMLSESVDSGVNNIQSVTYMSSKYDESYQEALKKAVEAARVKAEAIAEAGNCTLGNLVHVEEKDNYQQVRYTGYKNSAVSETMTSGAAADVMPGQVDVEARISVQFEINHK